jgi:hypothetical protein
MPDNDISKIPTLYLSPFIKLLIIVMLFLLDVDVSLLDIFDEDQKKHGDARSISQMDTTNLTWFKPS